MEWNETIEDAEVVIVAVSGVDNSTEEMLYRGVALSDTEVSQQIQRGQPGVIYLVTCSALGTTGKLYARTAHLAILPDDAVLPPHIGTHLTSRIYPIDTVEYFQHSVEYLSGNLRPQPFLYEYFQHGMEHVSGLLQTVLIETDAPTESFQHDFAYVNGSLYTSLISFNTPVESYDHGLAFVGGTLVVALVSYDFEETYQHSFSFVSGSLHA
jgi:hypothetical protein